ncbi:hypothetical protein [Candidatus Palauibacter sp.]|uniref:hypothetical protein n=1 Tax=Candidatus Palauibacter sp. TaxID=3101350 RepID=UPI003B58CC35
MEDTGIRRTANDRFKLASPKWTQVGLLVAVCLHFGLFVLVQPFEAADLGGGANEIESINFPPEVRIPPPPEAIARPAAPRIPRSRSPTNRRRPRFRGGHFLRLPRKPARGTARLCP